MYDNIGKKLMDWAKALCVLGIITSVIVAIVLWSIKVYSRYDYVHPYVLHGFIVLIFGSLFSWTSTWVMYAIGEIADNTEQLVKTRKGKHHGAKEYQKQDNDKQPANVFSSDWKCSNCGNINAKGKMFCKNCGLMYMGDAAPVENADEKTDNLQDDTWVCSKCGNKNPINTDFCKVCSTEKPE